jgi:hypothetical protein
MASKIYKGKNVRLSFNGKTLFHTTSCTLGITTTLEELATKDTNGTISTPGSYAWTLGTNSLVADKDSANTAQTDFMGVLGLQLAGAELDVEFTTNSAGDFILSGKAYIESCNITAEVGNTVTGDFSLKGNGNLTKSTVPDLTPQMTSSNTIAVENGVDGSFQVTAENGPLTSFGITGTNPLPGTGISFNNATGLFTWTDNAAEGTYVVQLVIFNADGFTQEDITITVS